MSKQRTYKMDVSDQKVELVWNAEKWDYDLVVNGVKVGYVTKGYKDWATYDASGAYVKMTMQSSLRESAAYAVASGLGWDKASYDAATPETHPYKVGKMVYKSATEAIAKAKAAAVKYNVVITVKLWATDEVVATATPQDVMA